MSTLKKIVARLLLTAIELGVQIIFEHISCFECSAGHFEDVDAPLDPDIGFGHWHVEQKRQCARLHGQRAVVKYLETPPSEKELAQIVEMLGIQPEQLVRKKEKWFGELHLGDKPLSDQEWFVILAKHPKLIERPIVVHNNKAAIGRPLENISDLLSDHF